MLIAGAVLAALTFAPSAHAAPSPDLVISEVYGGGGNSGAPYSNDFIELSNRGSAPVPLGGRSLQYASATGTGNLGAN
jgi:predicted extracellular nuclease